MALSRYQRNLVLSVTFMAVALPFLAPAAVRCLRSMYTSPSDWAPPSHRERQEYEAFIRAFEREDAIVVAWPGCTVDDPRLARLEASLAAQTSELQGGSSPLIERVISGPSLLARLTGRPLDLSPSEAQERLRGIVLGADGRSTCVVVVLTDHGARERQTAMAAVLRHAAAATGLPAEDLHMAGNTVVAATIDQESLRTLDRYIVPSALVSLLLCWWRLRSWRYTLAIVAVAGIGEAVSLAVVYYTGMTMNAMLIVMPPLIFVLVVSAGVHLVNYYLDQVRLHGAAGAPERAVKIGWTPCWVCAITTAIGMGSLLVSDIEPIRQFGVLSALGLLFSVAMLFLLLPGVLERWPFQPHPPRNELGLTDADELSPLTHHFQRWERFANYVTHHGALICILCATAMAVAGWGLTRLSTSVDVRALFDRNSRILRDVAWLEQNIGPLTPVEVIVHFEPHSPLDTAQRVRVVEAVHRRIQELAMVGGVMSAVTLAPENFARPVRGAFAHARREAGLRAALRRFEEARFLAQQDGRQSWRISARVHVHGRTDYADYLRQIRSAADPVFQEVERAASGSGVSMTLTGVVPLSDQVHKILLADLYSSFLTAFLLVGLVMAVTLRGVTAGLISMLPNVFPMVLVFGALGWAGLAIDIGAVMTASIALGIAVDDTLHFLTWFGRETSAGASPEEAVRKTFRHCGRAMVQSTLISGLGLLVFSLSGFLPTQRFAWMIMCLLLAALVGDLLFLPALLVGPLGKIFVRPKSSESPLVA